MIGRFIQTIILSVALLGSFSAMALANVSVEAFVDQKAIGIGESTRLTLKISGVQKIQPIMTLPPMDGLELHYVGQSSQVQFINGQGSSSISFRYTVFPLRTGTLTIPSLTLSINGQDYQTDPITLEVGASSSVQQSTASGEDVQLFRLDVELDKEEAFIGEEIPLMLRLFVHSDLQLDQIDGVDFEQIGFTSLPFGQGRKGSAVIDGMTYTTYQFHTTIFPTRTGSIDIGPIKLHGTLLTESSRRSGLRRFFSFAYERRPMSVLSEPQSIMVSPLPEEGQSEYFSGGVGTFHFAGSASPRDLQVGDPITLRMSLRGTGNLKAVQMPQFSHPDFKVYDPQMQDDGQQKILEQVIIPTHEDITEIPMIIFEYFDPKAKEYRRNQVGPFPIDVKPAPEGTITGVLPALPVSATVSAQSLAPEKFGRDIIYLKEDVGDLKNKGMWFLGSTLFWIWMGLYALGLSIWLFYDLILRFWLADENLMRQMKAYSRAKKGMHQALKEVDAAFKIEQLTQVMRQYFADKFLLAESRVTVDEIQKHMKVSSIPEDFYQELDQFFQKLERVQFAKAELTTHMINDCFQQAQHILTIVEKARS